MQISNSKSPAFKGYDYIPCVMNKKQIDAAEKIFRSVVNSPVYKKADECLIDIQVMPKDENKIILFLHDIYNEQDVRGIKQLLKTTFNVDDSKYFDQNIKKVIENIRKCLHDKFNIDC